MSAISKLAREYILDIHGRLIPGFVAALVWPICAGANLGSFLYSLYSGSTALRHSSFALILTTLVASYVIGYFTAPLSGWLHSWVLPILFPTQFNVLRRIILNADVAYSNALRDFYLSQMRLTFGDDFQTAPSSRYRQNVYVRYDWLRGFDPTVGVELEKARAEYRMLEGLYVTFGIGTAIALLAWNEDGIITPITLA